VIDVSAGAMSFAHLPDRGYLWIVQNFGDGWIGRVDFTPLTYAKIHALTFKFEEASLKVYNKGESPTLLYRY